MLLNDVWGEMLKRCQLVQGMVCVDCIGGGKEISRLEAVDNRVDWSGQVMAPGCEISRSEAVDNRVVTPALCQVWIADVPHTYMSQRHSMETIWKQHRCNSVYRFPK